MSVRIFHRGGPTGEKQYLVGLDGKPETWPDAEAAWRQIRYICATRGWGTNAPAVVWEIEQEPTNGQ